MASVPDLTLTQDRDLLKELGPVKGAPKKGKTLLLFEDDVVALVRYLANRLVEMNDAGEIVNGLAEDYQRTRKQPRQGKRRPGR
jgi:hypothetical protein